MKKIPSGSTIGILGGGQLGRMTAIAAAELGYKCHIFCPEKDAPALHVSHAHTRADFSDDAALKKFASSVDVVTLEWENVPMKALEAVSSAGLLCPNKVAMQIAQDRGLFLNPPAWAMTAKDRRR
jgi:5-(carboxyamino)imidazole ribonucleotide synthase